MKTFIFIIILFTYLSSYAQEHNKKFVQFVIVTPKNVNLPSDVYYNINLMANSANKWMLSQTGKQIRIRKDKDRNLDFDLIKLDETYKDIINIGNNLPIHMYKILKKKYKNNKDIVMFIFASDVNLKSKSHCGVRTGEFAGLYINNEKCGHKYNSGKYQGWDKIFVHEVIHALHGVEKCAKNSDGYFHVTDSSSDLMHKNGGGREPKIDVNRDDYFAHDIENCFDLNDSKLLY
jgi:hypothetical protein